MQRLHRILLFVLILAGGVCGLLSCTPTKTDYSRVGVIRVFDGDTIHIDTGDYVRFIGIDCPETSDSDKLYRQAEQWHINIQQVTELGRKAAAYTNNLVFSSPLRLEFDVERYDKYGRLLAYVYLPDGTMVNEALLLKGYAGLLNIPPNVKYADRFKELYKEAWMNEQGLWGR